MSCRSDRRDADRSRCPRARARSVSAAAEIGTVATLVAQPPLARHLRVAHHASGRGAAYGEIVDRTPSFLAALASAAVPGLDPVSVEALPSLPEHRFDIGFVMDSQHRRWVVRAPRDEMTAVEMDRAAALFTLLGRRLPFAVPLPKGFIELRTGGRAMVYPYIPGHQVEVSALPPGPGLAAEIGRALAAIHNLDPRLVEEAGLPIYDAAETRARRLTDLDRAAATGRVPQGLLSRWESALEDVALWQFAATPVHGAFGLDHVLVIFEDDLDASTGTVRGVTGWEAAHVGDPAEDLAHLRAFADPGAVETVVEAYAHARVERPDPNLLIRARLISELALARDLLMALTARDTPRADVLSTELRRLDDDLAAHAAGTDDYRDTSLTPVPVRRTPAPPPVLQPEEDEDDLTGLPDVTPAEPEQPQER